MAQVAILGGGPAGAYAGERLAAAGVKVSLFDEKLAWEKPCGGGLTFKAYDRYPFLLDNAVPKRRVSEALLTGPDGAEATLKLGDPLLIYSRFDLNRMLLERAEAAGAQLEKARVQEITRTQSAWRLRTSAGVLEADYCIVATGARNPLREVGSVLRSGDSMSALGYYIPGDQERVDIQFLPQLEGYIWVFPRCGHLSVGICGKGEPASALRKSLESFMERRGISWKGAAFYSHLLPSLDSGSWRDNRVAGDGWMAVGDAAGLVDPITGEGLYYAIRSADLAASTFLSWNGGPASDGSQYRAALRLAFAADLELGAALAKRIFRGRFLRQPVTARTVQFTRRSPRFAAIIQDLFAGRQPYSTLRRRLLQNLTGSLYEIGMSLGFSRIVPRKAG